MPIETELKFKVTDPAIFGRIASIDEIAGYSLDDRGIVHIRDIAFDTPDFNLYRGFAVFRLRDMCGTRFMTFKTHKPSKSSYYQRIEDESPTNASVADITEGNLPDLPPTQLFRERFGDVALSPCLTTDNNRHVILLVRDHKPLYELALDDVTFSGPGGDAHIYEIEVEAMTVDHGDLEDIGAWLRDQFALEYAEPSKFVQGMNLVGDLT